MATINELKWKTLTAAVNEIKSPNQFLKDLLFGRVSTQPTENIEWSVLNKARQVAPFVRKNGSALLVSGYTTTNNSVEAPNIRIKIPFTPSDLLFGRRPATVIFNLGASGQSAALRRHIATDLEVMENLVVNSEEYLCSRAIQGAIAYQVAPEANFTITFAKPAGHTVVTAILWDDADPTLPRPEDDFLTAKELIHNEHGLGVTDAVMGGDAARSFVKVAKVQDLLDKINISAGGLDLNQQFRDSGAIFLGFFSGVRCWMYSRTVLVNGVATALIRANYCEFLAAGPAADNVLYYGAIPDMKTLQGRRFQGRRFSKSWEIEDPSAMMALLASRPLPVMRRPGSVVSMQVVT